jgi:hypothetical protein
VLCLVPLGGGSGSSLGLALLIISRGHANTDQAPHSATPKKITYLASTRDYTPRWHPSIVGADEMLMMEDCVMRNERYGDNGEQVNS